MGVTDSACCSYQQSRYQDIDSPVVLINQSQEIFPQKSSSNDDIKRELPNIIPIDRFTKSATTFIYIDSTLQKVIKFKKYEHVIEQVIQRLMKYDTVQNCSFENDFWKIWGKDSKSLNNIQKKFEFVCWRIPVTNAFHESVKNKEILFDRLLQLNICPPNLENFSRAESSPNISKNVGMKGMRRVSFTHTKFHSNQPSISDLKIEEMFLKDNQQLNDEIWDVFNKETFVQIFGQEIYDELPCIPKNAYEYLGHRNIHLSMNENMTTDEGIHKESLVTKLAKLESYQKFEIVIIGQRHSVSYLMRHIRECEVIHPSFQWIFNGPTTPSAFDRNSKMVHLRRRSTLDVHVLKDDGSLLKNVSIAGAQHLKTYECLISNIPPNVTNDILFDIFLKKDFLGILNIDIYENMRKMEIDKNLCIVNENKDDSNGGWVADVMFDSKNNVEKFTDSFSNGEKIEIEGRSIKIVGKELYNVKIQQRKERRLTDIMTNMVS